MSYDAKQIAPWRGVRNIGDPSDAAFQLPGKDGPRPFALSATNCTLNLDGLPRPLPCLRKIRDLSAAQSLIAKGGMLMVLHGDSLSLLADPDDPSSDYVAIDGELDPTGDLVAHEWPLGGNRVWLTDGERHWQIDSGAVRAWGFVLDQPTVTAVDSGALRAGQYLVSIAYRDGALNAAGAQESHIDGVEAVTLSRTGGIQLDVVVTDARATHVAVYASPPDQSELSLAGVAAVIEQPDQSRTATLTLTAEPRLNDVQALGIDFFGPPQDISALGSFAGWMLAGVGGAVFRSHAHRPGWWQLDQAVQSFAGEVRALAGVADGWYAGTAAGLYWISGDNPQAWGQRRVDTSPVLAGAQTVDCRLIPSVQFDGLGALFATRTGLLLGLPQGVVRRLTQDHWHFPTGDSATFAVREVGAEQQVWTAAR